MAPAFFLLVTGEENLGAHSQSSVRVRAFQPSHFELFTILATSTPYFAVK